MLHTIWLKQLEGIGGFWPTLNLLHLFLKRRRGLGVRIHGGDAPASAGDASRPRVDTAGNIGVELIQGIEQRKVCVMQLSTSCIAVTPHADGRLAERAFSNPAVTAGWMK